MWCAWVSIFLPVVALAFELVVPPTQVVAPEVVYWAMFACGVIGFILGCIGVSTIGRRVESMVLAPAILGIVISLAVCYFALNFGILGSTGPIPGWNQIFPWQGPPAGQHW
jgi:hypothetical protein